MIESTKTKSIQLYFGPANWGAPDNLIDPIVQLISQAKKHIIIVTQQFSHPFLIESIIEAKSRGLNVQVVIERDYIKEQNAVGDIWMMSGANEPGRQALVALLRGAVDVRIERRSRLLHNNFVLIDPEDPKLTCVASTSANLSPNDLHKNFNHLIVIKNPDVSAAFFSEFKAIWNDDLVSPHGGSPLTREIDGYQVKIIFGPEHAPEMEVIKQIAKAKQSANFSVSSFSMTSGVDDAFLAILSSGISVTGLLDNSQINQSWTPTKSLEKNGAKLYVTEDLLPSKLHHKMLLVDDFTIAIGTYNYSAAGARLNEEILIVLSVLDTVNKNKFLAYGQKEMNRIIELYCKASDALIWG